MGMFLPRCTPGCVLVPAPSCGSHGLWDIPLILWDIPFTPAPRPAPPPVSGDFPASARETRGNLLLPAPGMDSRELRDAPGEPGIGIGELQTCCPSSLGSRRAARALPRPLFHIPAFPHSERGCWNRKLPPLPTPTRRSSASKNQRLNGMRGLIWSHKSHEIQS